MNKIEFNTQIVTTKEQSNRLLDLGLNHDTADMSWVLTPISSECPYVSLIPYSETKNRITYNIIPAWSLHRLIEMFPYKVNKSSNDASLLQITRIKDNCYIVGYYGYKVVEMPLFEAVIILIEELIKDNLFNKDYLK